MIAALEPLAEGHRAGGARFFYDVRDGRFNPARAVAHGTYTPELAAMLIYLNRTGFNGLFRLNRRGEFNVPMGRYKNPRICDADHLRDVAGALGGARISIERGSFEQSLADAAWGDFVYCDPPYAPLSRTACFAQYTAGGFNMADQQRLQQAVVAAAERGAIVVVSNSSAREIEEIYRSAEARRAGLAADMDYMDRSVKGQVTQATRRAKKVVIRDIHGDTVRSQGERDRPFDPVVDLRL